MPMPTSLPVPPPTWVQPSVAELPLSVYLATTRSAVVVALAPFCGEVPGAVPPPPKRTWLASAVLLVIVPVTYTLAPLAAMPMPTSPDVPPPTWVQPSVAEAPLSVYLATTRSAVSVVLAPFCRAVLALPKRTWLSSAVLF